MAAKGEMKGDKVFLQKKLFLYDFQHSHWFAFFLISVLLDTLGTIRRFPRGGVSENLFTPVENKLLRMSKKFSILWKLISQIHYLSPVMKTSVIDS